MTDTTIDPSVEVTQGEPPTVDGPSVKPGYLTTEFWQTNLVHLFAAVSSLLVFFNVNLSHLTVIQGLIPLGALAASLIAQTAYNNKRAAVKIRQISNWGEVNVAKLAPLKPLEPLVADLVKAADPSLAAKVGGAAHALNEGWTEFPSADAVASTPDAAPVDAAPADATPVALPADLSTEDPAT